MKIPDSEIEQYKKSFFVRTVADWNLLEDTVVTADSVTAFSSAVGRVLQGAAPPTYRQSEQKCVLDKKIIFEIWTVKPHRLFFKSSCFF